MNVKMNTLKPGDHLCLLHESHDDWLLSIASFIHSGLTSNQKCLYITDYHTADEIREHLALNGVDIKSHLLNGQLAILDSKDVYLIDGCFDSGRTISLLQNETRKAMDEGYDALRATGEMSWAIKNMPGSDKLAEYEANLKSGLFETSACIAVCQYDLARFEPDILKEVLKTHPYVIWRGKILQNCYYDSATAHSSYKDMYDEIINCLSHLETQHARQKELAESEERYRALVDLSSEVGESILMVQDIEGKEGVITFASDQFVRITGYSKDELIGRAGFDFISPEHRQAALERHRRKMKGESLPGLYEINIVCKDGSYIDVELTSAVTRYKDRLANVIYLRDISERKELENKLADEKEKYQTIFEEAPIALWELDYSELKKYFDSLKSQGVTDFKKYFDENMEAYIRAVRISKMVRFNKGHRDLWELDDEDTFEDYWEKSRKYFFKGSDNYKALMDDFVRLAHGHTSFTKEEPVQTTRGNRRYILTRFAIAPGYEQTWARVFASLVDITDRKTAELKLQESEQKWHTLFQGAPVAMWELDYTEVKYFIEKLKARGTTDFNRYFKENLDAVKYCIEIPNKIMDVNAAAHRLFETSSFLELSEKIKSAGDTEESGYQNYQHILASLAGGENEIAFESNICTAKGNGRVVLIHYSVPHEQQQTLSRVFVSAVDITARKHAEGELKTYQKNLENMVKKRTEQLKKEMEQRILAEKKYKDLYEEESRLRREIEAVSEQRVRYTRSIVHELKTPLTSLVVANDHLAENLSGANREFALAARRSTLRLEHRINELLDVSKGEVGLLELDRNEINLYQMLKELVRDIKPLVHKANQQLKLKIDDNLPFAYADEGRINQVITNLVDNAIKFNSPGGTITIEVGCENGNIMFYVKDQGPGIKESESELLFEPYKGVKRDSSTGGLGLGLPLSKMLVELHGGDLKFETGKSNGSCFYFSIPLKQFNRQNLL